MEPWATALALWDKNKNGKLENAELPAGEVRTRFFRIDLDGDQALDEAEWNKYARHFRTGPKHDGGPAARRSRRGRRASCGNTSADCPTLPARWSIEATCILVKDGGIVTMLDAADRQAGQARPRLAARATYYASPVGGDGKIIVASGGGVVTVFEAGRNARDRLVARFRRADRRHARDCRWPDLHPHGKSALLLCQTLATAARQQHGHDRRRLSNGAGPSPGGQIGRGRNDLSADSRSRARPCPGAAPVRRDRLAIGSTARGDLADSTGHCHRSDRNRGFIRTWAKRIARSVN